MPSDTCIQREARRLPHAVLELDSRRFKAQKIERLLELKPTPQPLRLLEIGTGSGGIAHYFAHHDRLNCEAVALDVIDQRLVHDGFEFQKVTGTTLPFPDSNFDLVITNHVIEHVGELTAQRHHLSEVHRVMTPQATGYLAVPNRWMLVEPHYRLAFLSWLPRTLRTPYLRLARRGERYDCEPLTRGALERLLRAARFRFQNLGTRALRETLALEGSPSSLATGLSRMPDGFLNVLAPIVPTLIYRLNKTADAP